MHRLILYTVSFLLEFLHGKTSVLPYSVEHLVPIPMEIMRNMFVIVESNEQVVYEYTSSAMFTSGPISFHHAWVVDETVGLSTILVLFIAFYKVGEV